jgi:hypothetical protein
VVPISISLATHERKSPARRTASWHRACSVRMAIDPVPSKQVMPMGAVKRKGRAVRKTLFDETIRSTSNEQFVAGQFSVTTVRHCR